MAYLSLAFTSLFVVYLWAVVWARSPGLSPKPSLVATQTRKNVDFQTSNKIEQPIYCPRGGSTENNRVEGHEHQRRGNLEEEERYSRQVYAVGKRAHGLIRSSTIYLDGPAGSGLLYECAKNLALSGIRKIVLIVPEPASCDDEKYHYQETDDLGNAYVRAARAELVDYESSQAKILIEYIKRLNPFVDVAIIKDRDIVAQEDSVGRNVLLVVDRPYPSQVKLNNLARDNHMSFISVETAGVFGRVFCDFGPSFEVHDTDGETPMVTPLLRLEHNTRKDQHESVFEADHSSTLLVTIHSMEGEKHDVSKGDIIRFQYRNGDFSAETCRVVEVKTPFQFVAEFESNEVAIAEDVVGRLNEAAVSFSRVKIPQTIHFVTLEEATAGGIPSADMFTPCDLDKSWDDIRRQVSFGCFQSLASFAKLEGRLPELSEDSEVFRTLVGAICGYETGNTSQNHIKSFLSGCAAKFGPLQAVFGAIGAQEALKAVTGLFSPVKQFLMYDCDEVLSVKRSKEEKSVSAQRDDAGLRYILGDRTVNDLQSRRIFVVGAGAIGCEILKNLAAMGAATKGDGKVYLTDMDTIEKSNLSRQFLFRDNDIGKFKSLAAKQAVLRFQPSMQIEAHSAKVGVSEGNTFGGSFWKKKVDTVLNALDNMDARLFIDGQCVANQKSLVDAGTLGPKGNVQVVVPFKSESYASSTDPPEQAIPVCTLKNFPYAISHTIQWGRDLFDGFFRSRPAEATKFISLLENLDVRQIASRALSSMGEGAVVDWAENLSEDLKLAVQPDAVVREALDWSTKMAWKLFYKSINDLLEEHPLDSHDEDGEPFWSGSRRPPNPLKYSVAPVDSEQQVINSNMVDFVQNAARLRLESYKAVSEHGIKITRAHAAESLARFDFEAQHCDRSAEGDAEPSDSKQILSCLEHLSTASALPIMVSAEFEKDAESNGHVAFVNAASNLRALCYGIPPVDAMETRRIAGNIIPAMITTTAMVSALSCIELIKLVQHAELKQHRNAFINLALPFFAFTVPVPSEPTQGLHGREYTLWDRLSIKESKKAWDKGGLTMKSLIEKLKKLASDDPGVVDVASISLGPFLLYANFLHHDEKDFLKSTIWATIAEALEDPDEGAREGEDAASSNSYSVDDKCFDLTVVVEDTETGEEVELPTVSLKRYSPK